MGKRGGSRNGREFVTEGDRESGEGGGGEGGRGKAFNLRSGERWGGGVGGISG